VLRILIVDHAPAAIRNIERLLSDRGFEVVGTAGAGETGVEIAARERPDIALIDVDLPGLDGIRTTEMLLDVSPDTVVLAMGLDDDEESRALLRRAGATDYIAKPFGADELLSALRTLEEALAVWNAEQPPNPGGSTAVPTPSDAFEQPPPALQPMGAAQPPEGTHEGFGPPAAATTRHNGAGQDVGGASGPDQGGTVISVVSGKGGVGTSVLATNLAIMTAREGHRRVVVVDLDLLHGDVAALVGARGDGISTLAHLGIDAIPIESLLTATPYGISAVLDTPDPHSAPTLRPEQVEHLIAALRGTFDTIVIDLPSHLDQVATAALRNSDRIVVICGMSSLGVSSTLRLLSTLHGLGQPPGAVSVVLNRTEANSDLTRGAVEDALGGPTAVQLPYDPYVVSTSITRGTPFVVGQRSAQASRRIRELAGMLSHMPPIQDEDLDARTEEDRGSRRRGRRGLFGFART